MRARDLYRKSGKVPVEATPALIDGQVSRRQRWIFVNEEREAQALAFVWGVMRRSFPDAGRAELQRKVEAIWPARTGPGRNSSVIPIHDGWRVLTLEAQGLHWQRVLGVLEREGIRTSIDSHRTLSSADKAWLGKRRSAARRFKAKIEELAGKPPAWLVPEPVAESAGD